ncbi:MAG: T9SS type A sorting domain-containing protein [Bacteroidetes bacterium]|nr:T9SS type A sorting domain-containing protein [Bacteroidota bacterium]
MKKAFTLLAGIALTATSAFAQLTNGSTAPDWTLTDINGNSWHLYQLTAMGKTVFFDVSATWCGPCWNYHNGRALDSLYDQHGPSGTIDQMCYVFFIEGDGTTTSADLNGTGTNTQGNWVAGTNFPIIDPPAATINPWNTQYNIAYFPTIYMVCPNNKVYEAGQQNLAGLVSSMNICPYNLDALPNGAASLACTTTYAPQFTLKNNSISTALTSCDVNWHVDSNGPATYNWSGNLAAGASTTVTLPTQTLTAGNHVLYVATTNPNASTDNNINNDSHAYPFGVVTASGTTTPYTNAMTSTAWPYTNWIVSNSDGGFTWSHSTPNGGAAKYDFYNNPNIGDVDDMIVEPIDMSAMTSASLSFDVADARYSASYIDQLDVLVSTDCGATWTNVYTKSGSTLATVPDQTSAFLPTTANQWRNDCVNMTPFVGNNKVFIAFRATNGYGNDLYIDNINVSNAACATGIANAGVGVNNLTLFPNPSNDQANINFNLDHSSDVTINVYNMVGELVYSKLMGNVANGTQNVQMNTAELSNGLYMVELIAGGNRTVTRMTVSH